MVFEWDPAKAKSNQVKHGVSFDDACTVFLDSDALDGEDPAHSAQEPRFLRLGASLSGSILIVAYTMRSKDDGETKIRLISARKASRKERKAYKG
jgi:uncharacterized DUF497 family protein